MKMSAVLSAIAAESFTVSGAAETGNYDDLNFTSINAPSTNTAPRTISLSSGAIARRVIPLTKLAMISAPSSVPSTDFSLVLVQTPRSKAGLQ